MKQQFEKPIVRGTWWHVRSVKRVFKVLLLAVLSVIFFLLTSQLMLLTHGWLRVLVNGLILFSYYALVFFDGAASGEDDVTASEICYQQQFQGKALPAYTVSACYHPLKGWTIGVLGILPILILFVVFASVATRQHMPIGTLPGWLGSYFNAQEVQLGLSHYQAVQAMKAEDLLRIPVRLFLFPYVSMVGNQQFEKIYVLEKLSPLILLLIPCLFGIGYTFGPQRRNEVHRRIAAGKSKKAGRKPRAKRVVEQDNRLI